MAKKFILSLLAIVLIAAAALFLFGQRMIGERLFSAAVERQAGVDKSAELPDGLHVYVCGSGSPMPDAERAGPCLAVLAGRKAFIFDVGSGSMRKLGQMGFPMQELEAAFLTHLHSDHFDGLGELMLQAWIVGERETPLPVYGPKGTQQVVDGFIKAYEIDRGFRIAHHGPEVAHPGGYGADAMVIPSDGIKTGKSGIIYEDNAVVIRALPVDHAPVDHALAYRVDYAGRSIVISGDTKRSYPLAEFSQGTDVLFHEALNPAMIAEIGKTLEARGNLVGAKIMGDIPDYHTSPEDAARVAQQASVDTLVLYHLVPAPPIHLVERAFIGSAPDHFDGDLQLATDGMVVSLPAMNQEIAFRQLL